MNYEAILLMILYGLCFGYFNIIHYEHLKYDFKDNTFIAICKYVIGFMVSFAMFLNAMDTIILKYGAIK